MIPVNGATLEYNTNEAGMCVFKTNAGQCNFAEVSNIPYVDLKCAKSINNYPAVVGSVYRVTMTRQSAGSVNIKTNKNVVFSGAIKSVDIYVQGGGGGGGSGWYGGFTGYLYKDHAYTLDDDDKQVQNYYGAGCNGGWGGGGYNNKLKGYSPTSFINYEINIGSGGSGGKSVSGNETTWESNDTYAQWRTIDCVWTTGSNGSTGGTTKFSNLVYAIGGSGGTNADGSRYGSGKDGINGTGIGKGGMYGSHHHSFRSVQNTIWNTRWTGYAWGVDEAGSTGPTGFVILNNFVFK